MKEQKTVKQADIAKQTDKVVEDLCVCPICGKRPRLIKRVVMNTTYYRYVCIDQAMDLEACCKHSLECFEQDSRVHAKALWNAVCRNAARVNAAYINADKKVKD